MHRVLVAPDSLGGWLTAVEFCERLQKGMGDSSAIELVLHPLADGGEGSLGILEYHFDVLSHPLRVSGPSGETRVVRSGELDGTHIIESALAIGLPGGHGTGDPVVSSSRGLGEWIEAERVRPLIVGLGGSSTVDGGIGMLRGLGLEVLDASGNPVEEGARGLLNASHLVGEVGSHRGIEVWCDVRTTLAECTQRFGPQKGLSVDLVEPISEAMIRWGQILIEYTQAHGGLSPAIDVEGGGAAGGLGFALGSVMGARLVSGFQAIAERTGLAAELEAADWVICAEGQMDAGSFEGKPMGETIKMARASNSQVVALVGRALNVPPPPVGPDVTVQIGMEPSPDEALLRAIDKLMGSMGWGLRTEKC